MSEEFGFGVFEESFRLAIDVGNSRIKLGLFGTVREGLPTCVERTTVLSDHPLPWDLLRRWKSARPEWRSAVIAGSNPNGVARVVAEWPMDLGPPPRHITNDDAFPLRVDVEEPRRVGIDRLLNAVAVRELLGESSRNRRERRPLAVIVDSGTATTVDVVTPDGAFGGGAILPGLALSAKALHHYTALLPLVSVQELGAETPPAVGRNTREAIRSGLFWGQLGAAKELIARQGGESAAVVVTGGGGALLATFLRNAQYEPHLALQGLVLLAETSA